VKGKNYITLGKTLQVTFGGLRFNQGALYILLNVGNPTSKTITLEGLTGTIYNNGVELGYINKYDPSPINGNANNAILLKLIANPLALSSLMSGKTPKITISGNAIVNNTPIPFSV
jgi:LEA14-like dessication related protein